MNSVLPAVSPRTTNDAEVASRQAPGKEEVVLEEPRGDLPDSGSKGDKTPRAPSTALSRAPRQNLQRFRTAVGELLPRGASLLRRRPPSNRRCRTICWRCLKAPPSTRSTVLLLVQ